MEYENHKLHQKNTFLLACVAVSVISLILLPLNDSIKKVASMPITNSTMEKNKTNINNNPLSNNSIIVNKNPIYQASGRSLGFIKLNSSGFPQGVELIFENGTMNGVNKVTNLEAWIFSPLGAHGLGHGVISTKDKDKEMMSWTAHDTNGTYYKNGTSIYQGLIIFNTGNSTGKLAFLNNLRGICATEANGNSQTTKIWKLK
jgi:hypothetical protein